MKSSLHRKRVSNEHGVNCDENRAIYQVSLSCICAAYVELECTPESSSTSCTGVHALQSTIGIHRCKQELDVDGEEAGK
jgi:hypothetical protein